MKIEVRRSKRNNQWAYRTAGHESMAMYMLKKSAIKAGHYRLKWENRMKDNPEDYEWSTIETSEV